MKKWLCLVTVTCPVLLACSATNTQPEIPERGVTPGYICKADGLKSLVGQQVTGDIGAYALDKSGAKRIRWIPPRTAVTKDFRQDRLNIAYNDAMSITRVNCG